ncbi:nodulation protein H-like [Macadamia integrifolia]|uniref:nodulation protein H-like n=1 Tax=Macadamia integrifolia TaxID=60698 RepID=UPI001C4E8B35|nr:nodulation protein H-like [Macadamia integrifolia]
MWNMNMEKENIFSFKTPKRSPFLLRLVLFFFVMAFGVYICSVSLKQINVQVNPKNMVTVTGLTGTSCDINGTPSEETRFVHFPRPKTYSRGECACTPVRFFVILSMQRSGSGWFETLLNSHPNISSNGEIFSVKQRRSNISSILKTLDSVYSLDWMSSAAKNDCVSAVGFKWMLNQAVMVNHQQIVDYFNWKGVSVLFLFRRNLLRRLISLVANDYDREAKLLNGTHKSHVHTKEEAEILAQFKPTLNISDLISGFKNFEHTMEDSLQKFNSTRHIILYYEDLVNNQKVLSDVQEFLGVPIRKLRSHQVKIHTRPLLEQVGNWEDIYRTLKGTQYEHFLLHTDYII